MKKFENNIILIFEIINGKKQFLGLSKNFDEFKEIVDEYFKKQSYGKEKL